LRCATNRPVCPLPAEYPRTHPSAIISWHPSDKLRRPVGAPAAAGCAPSRHVHQYSSAGHSRNPPLHWRPPRCAAPVWPVVPPPTLDPAHILSLTFIKRSVYYPTREDCTLFPASPRSTRGVFVFPGCLWGPPSAYLRRGRRTAPASAAVSYTISHRCPGTCSAGRSPRSPAAFPQRPVNLMRPTRDARSLPAPSTVTPLQ
jgi:hypothetical protein